MTWLTDSTYLLVFVAGALGSFGHCIGMCGPLVASFSLPLAEGRLLHANLLYHLGRITTYGMIGGATGLTGSFVGVASHIASLQKIVMTATGLLIALTGVVLGGWFPALRLPDKAIGQYRTVGRIVRLVSDGGGPGAFFPLGLALGFLPCGLVYGALLSSARAGMEAGSHAQGFLNGFLMMVLFGAGTVPGLLIVAKAAGLLGKKLRTRLYRAAAVAMIATGILFTVRGAIL